MTEFDAYSDWLESQEEENPPVHMAFRAGWEAQQDRIDQLEAIFQDAGMDENQIVELAVQVLEDHDMLEEAETLRRKANVSEPPQPEGET